MMVEFYLLGLYFHIRFNARFLLADNRASIQRCRFPSFFHERCAWPRSVYYDSHKMRENCLFHISKDHRQLLGPHFGEGDEPLSKSKGYLANGRHRDKGNELHRQEKRWESDNSEWPYVQDKKR